DATRSSMRLRNSSVFARSCASDRREISGSSALISRTVRPYCFSSRSLRLPNIFLSTPWIITGSWTPAGGEQVHKKRVGKHPTLRSSSFAALAGLPQKVHRVLRHAAVAYLEMQ